MNELTFYKNRLLIAMPTLSDPNFHQAVTYIYEHNESGAMGIVINKPMRITLGYVLKHLSIPIEDPRVEEYPVILGGPVAQEQGFIIHHTRAFTDKPLFVNDEIAVSTSKTILQSIAQGEGPPEVMVSLGYSGWNPGQLEQEMTNNLWMVAPANLDIMFKIPFLERWRAAAALIGVDLDRLSPDVGHA